MILRSFEVYYTCRRCGNSFMLKQGDPSPDEDVRHCWDCIDEILPWRNS